MTPTKPTHLNETEFYFDLLMLAVVDLHRQRRTRIRMRRKGINYYDNGDEDNEAVKLLKMHIKMLLKRMTRMQKITMMTKLAHSLMIMRTPRKRC